MGMCRPILFIIVLAILVSGCAGDRRGTSPTVLPAPAGLSLPESRPFFLGMTPFPYNYTVEAIDETYWFVGEHADMIVDHFDEGVPWREAYNNSPYSKSIEDNLDDRARRLPGDHKVYLAVTPISSNRDGIAGYRAEGGNMEMPDGWKDKDFDDPMVIQAYTNYCRYMINRLKPDYMAYGIEANMLATKNPAAFQKYLRMSEQVYGALKSEYPALPIFVTIQADDYYKNEGSQREAVGQLLRYSDYVAVSAYPFTTYPDPQELPKDFFSAIRDLAPEKPFAVAETGFTAEDLVMKKAGFTIKGSPEWQAEYVKSLLNESDRLGAKFIVWFVSGDYDALWGKMESQGADELLMLWKDNGLVDGNRKPRPSLAFWDAWLKLPKK